MSKTQMSELEQVTTAELTDSERSRLLADERRRTVLAVLAERSTPLSVKELASAVVERETVGSGRDIDRQDEVLLTLHHVHLPLLDDVGVVDYDAEEHRVELR